MNEPAAASPLDELAPLIAPLLGAAEPAAQPQDPLREVRAALAGVPADGQPGGPFLTAAKAAWAAVRAEAAAVNREAGGRAAGKVLADGADRMLALLTDWVCERAKLAGMRGFAVLAMGSYARWELAPYSDIDLLLLHDEYPDERLEPLVGSLLRPLWDCGWNIGHAVRSPQECLRSMADPNGGPNVVETATAVMEARFVCGDRGFAESFLRQDLPSFFLKFGRAFVEAKFQETLARWRGQSVYRTQPNLKESPGALRDFQLAQWIDQASRLSGHLPRLKERPLVSAQAIVGAREGYERLLTFRVALHGLCKRKQDVLDYPMQDSVARELGYESAGDLKPSERLLRDYFRAATAIHRLASTVTRRYLEERAVASRDIEKLRRRRVDDDFTRIGEYLYAAHNDVFTGADWLQPALRCFVHCARLNITISQDVAEAIRARAAGMTAAERADPACAAMFLGLLNEREHVATALRLMRDTELLGAYMPEFGQIEGLVINDTFHDYPVDEHTLYVVEAMDRLYDSVEPGDRFRRGLLEVLPRPYMLRLACLFHDLGKSRGAPGHSTRGALMVPAIGERLGLSSGEIRTLILLVQEHLTLSKVSQRRDPGEGGLLKQLAEKIGTKEHLDLLFLLTYCDSLSVGKGSYPQWKDALLTELYISLRRLLQPGDAAAAGGTSVLSRAIASSARTASTESGRLRPVEFGTLEERLLAWAPDEAMREQARQHLQLVPTRYLAEVSFEEAVSHLEALRRLRTGNKEAVAAVRGTGALVDMWVVSTDRPKRFSQICGAFLGAGVSVIAAIAYTRSDGIILDHFRVAPGPDVATADDTFWAKVASGVVDTLSGKLDFRARIEAARKRIGRASQITREMPPEVRVDNSLSEHHTVVDVICGDRIGLLHGLTRALADLSCNIHFAKIATTQGLVTDVFYITEPGGEKVTDPEKMLNIRRLLSAVASEFQGAAK